MSYLTIGRYFIIRDEQGGINWIGQVVDLFRNKTNVFEVELYNLADILNGGEMKPFDKAVVHFRDIKHWTWLNTEKAWSDRWKSEAEQLKQPQ